MMLEIAISCDIGHELNIVTFSDFDTTRGHDVSFYFFFSLSLSLYIYMGSSGGVTISETGYLLLPSCHMAEISLKQRKSSKQPTVYILVKCSNRTLFHSLLKSNQRRHKFLDFNFDLRLDSLYFYRKSMEWVMKTIQLWPDFSKVAKHDIKEFSWWKGFLLTCSYRPYMFSVRKIT